MHSERKKAKAAVKRLPSKDYSMAELEIEAFNARNSTVVPRSHSSYSLPPRPPSVQGLPPRSPSSHSLPHKSVLRNSYSRQVRNKMPVVASLPWDDVAFLEISD